MKRRDLERHLGAHGCVFHHHGGAHDVWVNPANRKTASVPRHNESKTGLARGICRQLGIPPPSGR